MGPGFYVGCLVPGLFLMFFYGSRSGIHDSLMVPGWFKSERSAVGAK